MSRQLFTHPHLLQEHQLGEVLLAVYHQPVLAQVLRDVPLPGLKALVALKVGPRVDARLRADDLLRDFAVLMLEERDGFLFFDGWEGERGVGLGVLGLPSVDLDQFVHDCLVLALDGEDALLPLEVFEAVDVRLGGFVGLVGGHAGLWVGELLHVQLVLPQLLVVVEGVVTHSANIIIITARRRTQGEDELMNAKLAKASKDKRNYEICWITFQLVHL